MGHISKAFPESELAQLSRIEMAQTERSLLAEVETIREKRGIGAAVLRLRELVEIAPKSRLYSAAMERLVSLGTEMQVDLNMAYADQQHNLAARLTTELNDAFSGSHLLNQLRVKLRQQEKEATLTFNRGRYLEKKGKTSEAIARYEEILRLHPSTARASLAEIRLEEIQPDSLLLKAEKAANDRDKLDDPEFDLLQMMTQ